MLKTAGFTPLARLLVRWESVRRPLVPFGGVITAATRDCTNVGISTIGIAALPDTKPHAHILVANLLEPLLIPSCNSALGSSCASRLLALCLVRLQGAIRLFTDTWAGLKKSGHVPSAKCNFMQRRVEVASMVFLRGSHC